MVQVMGLSACQHTVIGTRWTKGVSGGEAKRVSIGTCLLQRPRCLFLVRVPTAPPTTEHTQLHGPAVLFELSHEGSPSCNTLEVLMVL
jgi:predicted ABC-type transport system involved in lysophospholipase L1 biosynthesis ATPase subunit